MKKLIMLTLALLLLPFSACTYNTDGTPIVFEATSLGKTAVREEKTITIKDHEFIYFNVCSDDDGNFILASHDAYISNNDIQFGVRFKHVANVVIYDTTNQDNYVPLDPMSKEYDNGDWGYQVNSGFTIRQNIVLSIDGSPYNIGKITHWC